MESKSVFKEVTEELLEKTKTRHYGGGNELKVGDKVTWGMTINYANLYGTPPQEIKQTDPASLTLNMFVIKDSLLYQLYKQV